MMTISEKILSIIHKMDEEHCELVLFELEETSQEYKCRTEAMGFTMKILKLLFSNHRTGNYFRGNLDRLIFIILYPLSVSFMYAVTGFKKIFFR